MFPLKNIQKNKTANISYFPTKYISFFFFKWGYTGQVCPPSPD